ncbi:MAG: IS200/IS605 family transposase [Clostridiales bacterium]|nr:IS200/IS605 family transposase [Clostridiales bacterium]
MNLKNDAVAFIVANDVLKKHVEMIMHEQVQSGDAVVVKADVNNIEQTGRALVDSGIGAIVARGGTYADLKRDIKSVPVIKIEVSVADILFSLDKAKREYKRIYLILHDSIFFDFDAWKSLLNIQMTVYRYVSVEELKNILNQLEYDDDTVADRAKVIFSYIASGYGIEVDEWNHDGAHIHVMFRTQPKSELSKFISAYKSAGSRLLKKEFPAIRKKLCEKTFWSQSFCLITAGGALIGVIRK